MHEHKHAFICIHRSNGDSLNKSAELRWIASAESERGEERAGKNKKTTGKVILNAPLCVRSLNALSTFKPLPCRFVHGRASTKALESEEMCTCLINQFLAARKGPNCGVLPPTHTLSKPPGSKGIRQRAFCKVTDVATGRPVKQKHSTACSAGDPDWHSVWLESKMSPRKRTHAKN